MRVKAVKETAKGIKKGADKLFSKTKTKSKSGDMSNLSNAKTGQINRQGGGYKTDKNTNMDGIFRQPRSTKLGQLAVRKTSWKSKAKGAFNQAKKDIGGFAKTSTGKAVGKGIALATAGEVGYEVGKAKHQNIKTIKIKKA
tara:strand:- start:203 stop:625 length:423 start_codon:yes stop_codon:yes gene_type:complete